MINGLSEDELTDRDSRKKLESSVQRKQPESGSCSCNTNYYHVKHLTINICLLLVGFDEYSNLIGQCQHYIVCCF